MAITSIYKVHGLASVREWVSRNKILVIAVCASVMLHIFWLSIVRVVFAPPKKEQIKFSKVSFIGPILERGIFEVRIEPRQRALLEKRYLRSVELLGIAPSKAWTQGIYPRGSADAQFSRTADAQLTELIADAVNGPKLEPEYGAE